MYTHTYLQQFDLCLSWCLAFSAGAMMLLPHRAYHLICFGPKYVQVGVLSWGSLQPVHSANLGQNGLRETIKYVDVVSADSTRKMACYAN